MAPGDALRLIREHPATADAFLAAAAPPAAGAGDIDAILAGDQ